MFKRIFSGLLIVFSSVAFAQDPQEEFIPGYCSAKSKNPICWEGEDQTQILPQAECLPKYSCQVVESVRQESSGDFKCKGTNGQTFFCNKLVKELGANLKGLLVMVTTTYVDTCHQPGACGSKACLPSYGAASLDQSCQ